MQSLDKCLSFLFSSAKSVKELLLVHTLMTLNNHWLEATKDADKFRPKQEELKCDSQKSNAASNDSTRQNNKCNMHKTHLFTAENVNMWCIYM